MNQRFQLGPGWVTCNPSDGAVEQAGHPAQPRMRFLLTHQEASWHHAPHRWGKGFLITNQGSGRWDHPERIRRITGGFHMVFEPIPGIVLTVTRRFGKRWQEHYCLWNRTGRRVRIDSWAISTPFHDVYPSARQSLESACHAHVWTGGAFSYVWAIPMNGKGPGLGLRLLEGALWSYSVESRDTFTGSNVRGHLYLQATDAARSPHAFGGQPTLVLQANQRTHMKWDLDWYPDFPAFRRKALRPAVSLPVLAAPVGTPLSMNRTKASVRVISTDGARARTASSRTIKLTGTTPGIRHITVADGTRQSRVAVLFHHPLRTLVERRIRYILDHQRATSRAADRRAAFVPYDTQWNLAVNGAGWYDWSDARERFAMPILLQLARQRNWGDTAAIDTALTDFSRYCRRHLVDPDGSVMEDSFHRTPRRLYNFPWAAHCFIGQYRLYRHRDDLLTAWKILDRYYAMGGTHFLAFLGECAPMILEDLVAAGHKREAARLRARILRHADYFVSLGRDLPRHEVNYEQTVVAPLVQLLENAYRIKPARRYADALRETMRWLLAFAGEQPHVRLRHIGIRHWDGFWFGRYRQWGDIMPHYWTVQTAAALINWPETLSPIPDRLETARAILDANLAHFHDDGSATCAFVFPACVNGQPAHHEDPLANDQDWSLVYHLHYLDSLAPVQPELSPST
ncbi:MAG: hypothetical protein A2498_01175 [Lentisphaerae bacterium RIFOXYC12_FULL_60_16]|nr:MAG: hypothetical protein A2498_01175 [Lentisphaerae bacterium RIFOXYC12_FULL_60_16]OGV86091.1 MAG: hypothetical protein A2340_02665 [Lentisphaerae bacterium RIFOXYB12_FULL_60_10]